MADGAPLNIALVVFDTGPLITLAAAESLDYLKLPAAPVLIPDAVFYEATMKHGALGAQDITEWVQANGEVVRVVPTRIFIAAQALLTNPIATAGQRRDLTRDIGERAALEVIGAQLDAARAQDRALLVLEDNAAARAARLEREIIPISTTDFLKTLEAEGRINSADAVLDRAQDAGRHVSRMELLEDQQARALDALKRVMATQQ